MSSSQCLPRLLYCLFDPAESLPFDVPREPGTDLQVHIATCASFHGVESGPSK